MKKILGLAAALMMTVLSFGQATVSFNDATEGYDKTATTNFNFIFSPAHDAEQIKTNAGYYESYFTVAITPAGSVGNNVTISLMKDNEMGRRIVERLFVSLDVKAVNVNGDEVERHDFVVKYIAVE